METLAMSKTECRRLELFSRVPFKIRLPVVDGAEVVLFAPMFLAPSSGRVGSQREFRVGLLRFAYPAGFDRLGHCITSELQRFRGCHFSETGGHHTMLQRELRSQELPQIDPSLRTFSLSGISRVARRKKRKSIKTL